MDAVVGELVKKQIKIVSEGELNFERRKTRKNQSPKDQS